jgi:hypothetical protein
MARWRAIGIQLRSWRMRLRKERNAGRRRMIMARIRGYVSF